MSMREAILSEHREAILRAAAGRGAERIALFGSTARGEDTETSDCDFLVDFAPGASLNDLVGLQDDLAHLIGRPADVLCVDRLRERHRRIAEDAIVL